MRQEKGLEGAQQTRMRHNWACNCKLEIVVIELGNGCKVHKQVSAPPSLLQRYHDLVRYQRAELHEAGLISDAEYAALVGDSEAVARLHSYDDLQTSLAAAQSQLQAVRQDYQDLVAHEQKKTSELASEICRLNARLSTEIHRIDDLKDQVKNFEENYVHQDLLLDCQDKLQEAENPYLC